MGVEYQINVAPSNQQLAFDLVNPEIEDDYGVIRPQAQYFVPQRQSFSQQHHRRNSNTNNTYSQHPPQPQQYPFATQAQQQQQAYDNNAYISQQQQQIQQQQQQQYYAQQQQQPQQVTPQQYPQYMHNQHLYGTNAADGVYEQSTQQFLNNNNNTNPNNTDMHNNNNNVTNASHYNRNDANHAYTGNTNNTMGQPFVGPDGVYYTNANQSQQQQMYGMNGAQQQQQQQYQMQGQNAQQQQTLQGRQESQDGMMGTTTMPSNYQMGGYMEQQGHYIIPIEYAEILFEAEIGRGASGKVFKARWRNSQVVAKRFRSEDVDEKKAQSLIDDLTENTNVFDSPHVLQIYGYCKNNTLPFCLVTEYMDQGSVKNYVRRDRPGATSISILERLEIGLQAAKGLQHLHQHNFIHRYIFFIYMKLVLERVYIECFYSFPLLAKLLKS